MKTFKALSALLDYPTGDLQAAVREIRIALHAEGMLRRESISRLDAVFDMLAGHDLLTLQERWVSLFDRVRSLSLHLFEHVHGDSRDRGPAMVDLIAHYQKGGFSLSPDELPDYLPVVLEFCSQLPAGEARMLLADVAPLLAPIQARLSKRASPYAAILAAVRELSGAAESPADDGAPDRDPTLEEIDRDWAEAEVRFGPGTDIGRSDGCGKAAEWVARMNAS